MFAWHATEPTFITLLFVNFEYPRTSNRKTARQIESNSKVFSFKDSHIEELFFRSESNPPNKISETSESLLGA